MITDKWEGKEFFKIDDFHHVEFFVNNAKQAVFYYNKLFGFDICGYKGPETNSPESVSYLLRKNCVNFVFTSPIKNSHPSCKWLAMHGEGVFDIAFKVNSAENALNSCLERDANEYSDIEYIKEPGYCRKSIKTYGNTIHSFIEDANYDGYWAPLFEKINDKPGSDSHLIKIDHIVGNVEKGKMRLWQKFYSDVFGFMPFVKFDADDISTQFSSLQSVVMRSKNWKIKLPINEPADGINKSQIQEYLDFNQGPGVQHIAILTDDIISSIENLRANGVEFLDVPDSYYDNIRSRIGSIDEDLKLLQKNRILIDRDAEGYLLQLFTKPLEDKPTLFIEIIQRKGSRGFGQGNFQALFEAIEREQGKRGNL